MSAPKGKKHRKCIFCGGENVSKEHFYSAWMKDLLNGGNQHAASSITTHPVTGVQISEQENPSALQGLQQWLDEPA